MAGMILHRMLDAARSHRVQLDPGFTRLVVGVLTLEGVGRALDPSVDIFASALPLLLNAQQEYRAAAKQLVKEEVKRRLWSPVATP